MEYGLIGSRVSHSFSKFIHEDICNYCYELLALPTQKDFSEFMQKKAFKAINVTIPYKQDVIPYLDHIDETALKIGAVNVVVNTRGSLKGYNTDYEGLLYLAASIGASFKDKKVLILGTGGTRKTALTAAVDNGAREVLTVSRTKCEGVITYDELSMHADADIIINTSPVGMFPDNESCPVDINTFSNLHAVIDAVYNPLNTCLIQAAKAKGIMAAGGLGMLTAQAVAAARLFTGKHFAEDTVKLTEKKLRARVANLVLIGMPSCGKTSLGKALAKHLSKEFIDIDERIVSFAGKSIPQIFEEKGEAGFRDIEQEVICSEAKLSSRVTATGGGCVLRHENIEKLKQNGIIIYVRRPIEALATGGERPLSTSVAALQNIYAQRAPLYEAACNAAVDNTGSFEKTIGLIEEKFYEAINN